MDPYSSSSRENFNIKTRKPYTITKQRERWTEDEHNSFLEALKLYGRAWQRIEEHIGTKTAVQIRSHAQKFFTKLEKEAVARGVPIRQALDMEIPPPRPKRKPNYPYPRKIGPQNHPDKDGIQATLVSSVQSGIQILDLEKKPLPETTSNEQKPEENAKLDEQVENACELLPSDNENLIPRQAEAVNLGGAFREFIPEAITHDEANESYITIETREHQKLNQDGTKHIINTTTCNTSSLFEKSHETIIHCQYSDKLKQQPGNVGALSINDIQGVPRHVPVQVVDGNQGINAKNPDTSFQESTLNNSGGEVEHPNSSFVNIAASAVTGHHNSATRSSSYHQTVPPTFHPLSSPLCDNNHRSFLHVSSTISSLIVSSLLQNPAAHAAASFAATYWHPTTTEASSADSPESTPSMAAIAAATVAAATAWWAAHGLLPVCTPFYPGYSSTSPFSYGTPPIGGGNQARVANNGGGEKEGTVQEEKMNEGFPKEHPHPGSVDLLPESSEDSDGQGDDKKSNAEPIAEEMAPATTELHDSDKTNNVRKQVDRSSCGSNTTSSSEIETDALPKHGKEREEAKGSDVNLDSISRTRSSGRSTISPNESWKEVSEEGRLAFQALFSRQVLPQSFCNAVTSEENGNQNGEGGVSHLDLNREAGGEKDMVDEGLLRMGLGSVKLNIHHTGFKPYKRCSIEAKEGKIVSQQNDEKGPKRMRLEADQLQLD